MFGLSAVPWTAVIGVILAALALGSHWGGRMADAGDVPLSTILMIAGFTAALPVVGGGFPWVARDLFGFIPGAVASALVLFAPPVLLRFFVDAVADGLQKDGHRLSSRA